MHTLPPQELSTLLCATLLDPSRCSHRTALRRRTLEHAPPLLSGVGRTKESAFFKSRATALDDGSIHGSREVRCVPTSSQSALFRFGRSIELAASALQKRLRCLWPKMRSCEHTRDHRGWFQLSETTCHQLAFRTPSHSQHPRSQDDKLN